MKLDDTDFVLFGVPVCFAQDRAALDVRWKILQAEVHPDRFAVQGAVAQRVSMQWAVRVNQAYQRLKDPLQRAVYLCELHGVPVDAERNTAMPTQFLMQQMAWREALEEAGEAPQVEALADDVAAARAQMLKALAGLIDERADWPAAAAQVRALRFVERFSEDVRKRLDVLDA